MAQIMPDGNRLNSVVPERPRLGRRLLIGVNVALVLVLGMFTAWDYHATSGALLAEKRQDLQDEARTLLLTLRHRQTNAPSALQAFIDEVCGAMQESTNPGHHIAVQLGPLTLQARAHHRASEKIFQTIQTAIARPDGIATLPDGTEIIAGTARGGDLAVYVSEYLSTFDRIMRQAILSRISAILAAGLALGAVLNLVLRKLLVRPLNSMAQVVGRFSRGEHSARMPHSTTRELGVLADEFDSMASDLQRAETLRGLEMERARRIQEHLLPSLEARPGLSLASVFQPAAGVAGDYYDLLPLPDNGTLACIADVTGHGVGAAMGAAMLKTLLKMIVETETRPDRLLARLDAAFHDLTLPDIFASMIILCIAPGARRFRFANAGHPPAYLIRQNGEVEMLSPTGPLVGVASDAEWEQQTLSLSSGDRILFYTDGVIEAMSVTQEPFGDTRLEAIVMANKRLPIGAIADAIKEAVSAHCGTAETVDDITVFGIEVS